MKAYKINGDGMSLVIQGLRLDFPVYRYAFDPWLGRKDPTDLRAKMSKQKTEAIL